MFGFTNEPIWPIHLFLLNLPIYLTISKLYVYFIMLKWFVCLIVSKSTSSLHAIYL